ncbi:ABC transporter permease [Desulfurococcus mucosus]|uniref:ABC-2 type transporter n=1 Tax=Desulfurococcus mucosus (strain ATCC 35584 / DSM 2162 / JCM 9187 / O7/1) TaxID=765177 RepID=E8R6Y0_DESM0|nr:ABC transporter permease [Desulfurococcus mucosus]ADV64413.1 ABC-2 type transporter [Desulfurococcus mucosus DSM 2162]
MMEDLKSAALIAQRDLARFWRYKYWLAGQVAMNLADIFIFGLIFRGMVNPALIPDYIKFITPGILSLSIFISSFSIGREVGVELRREVTLYLVSLPVKRTVLVAGRILGGLLRGLIYQLGFLFFAALLLGIPNPSKWIIILYTTLLLAASMSGLSISLSTVTRDFNLQATIRSLTYNVLFFVSNIFYPESVVKARLGFAAPVVKYSPLSMATSIYRWGFNYTGDVDVLFNAVGLLMWSIIILAVACKLYLRNLAG